MTNFRKTNLSDKKTSYEVSLILAKNGKGFRDRETVKKCAIFCLLFVRTDVAVCGPRINIQKTIWPATLSTLDHPALGYLINEALVSNDQTHLYTVTKREILKGGGEAIISTLFFQAYFCSAELI